MSTQATPLSMASLGAPASSGQSAWPSIRSPCRQPGLTQQPAWLADLGASVIVPRHSRYVIDLNRPPEDAPMYPGANNTELCPTRFFTGEPLASRLALAGVVIHVIGHALAKALGFYASIPLLRLQPRAISRPVRGLARLDTGVASALAISLISLSGRSRYPGR